MVLVRKCIWVVRWFTNDHYRLLCASSLTGYCHQRVLMIPGGGITLVFPTTGSNGCYSSQFLLTQLLFWLLSRRFVMPNSLGSADHCDSTRTLVQSLQCNLGVQTPNPCPFEPILLTIKCLYFSGHNLPKSSTTFLLEK